MKTEIKTAEGFLRSKGLLSNDKTLFQITFRDESSVTVNELLDEYAYQFKPKWISVEEYLPTQEGDYLITDGDSQFVSNYENSNWYFFGVNFWTANEVTHWMPLPTPPEP